MAAYVELIRNTPFLVQVFLIFFGLPTLGVRLDANEGALIAMVLNGSAYTIEIVRAGIEAVGHGQIEAARAWACAASGCSAWWFCRRRCAPWRRRWAASSSC